MWTHSDVRPAVVTSMDHERSSTRVDEGLLPASTVAPCRGMWSESSSATVEPMLDVTSCQPRCADRAGQRGRPSWRHLGLQHHEHPDDHRVRHRRSRGSLNRNALPSWSTRSTSGTRSPTPMTSRAITRGPAGRLRCRRGRWDGRRSWIGAPRSGCGRDVRSSSHKSMSCSRRTRHGLTWRQHRRAAKECDELLRINHRHHARRTCVRASSGCTTSAAVRFSGRHGVAAPTSDHSRHLRRRRAVPTTR